MGLNKKKIINDPVYGFISIPYESVFDLIEHPWFQRLRRIRQLGLTHLVYPGALHTRFHHALGAMHLMGQTIETLRSKGHDITEEESEAVTIAILLHDIGHGPFSHALEHSLIEGISHETISALVMDRLNKEFGNKLNLAIKIFKNAYRKHFLHQLVSSQLDMDRLDYLNRDSFFTGVSEGVISSDRIIKMLDVKKDQLVVEEKGIYSIEKFIIARRLMYWQVYLHKTVISAEMLLVKILKRAKEIHLQGQELFATPALYHFLSSALKSASFKSSPKNLEMFMKLDDYDIFTSVKVWKDHPDPVLSQLCTMMEERKLPKILMRDKAFPKKKVAELENEYALKKGFKKGEGSYFVFADSIVNNAYTSGADKINILRKDGSIDDIASASDQLNITALSKPVSKYYLCYPAGLNIDRLL